MKSLLHEIRVQDSGEDREHSTEITTHTNAAAADAVRRLKVSMSIPSSFILYSICQE